MEIGWNTNNPRGQNNKDENNTLFHLIWLRMQDLTFPLTRKVLNVIVALLLNCYKVPKCNESFSKCTEYISLLFIDYNSCNHFWTCDPIKMINTIRLAYVLSPKLLHGKSGMIYLLQIQSYRWKRITRSKRGYEGDLYVAKGKLSTLFVCRNEYPKHFVCRNEYHKHLWIILDSRAHTISSGSFNTDSPNFVFVPLSRRYIKNEFSLLRNNFEARESSNFPAYIKEKIRFLAGGTCSVSNLNFFLQTKQ